jgi:hypothetical protein
VKKYISIVLVLCFVCTLYAQPEVPRESINDNAHSEVVDIDAKGEWGKQGEVSLLRPSSYSWAEVSWSTSAQPFWFEPTEDTARVSVEEEETKADRGFNWKGCCIAGGCAAGLVVFIFVTSMGHWLATH